jgi:hypothetical protein
MYRWSLIFIDFHRISLILDSGKKNLNTGKVETGKWKLETESRTHSTPGGVGG